jgi:hypothetical protein
VNLFVASFIGSPAMSLIPLEAQTVGSRTVLGSAEGWTLTLADQNARKVGNAKSRKVVLGARHSTIRLHKSQVDASVPAKVYTVEPTGDVTFVQVFLSPEPSSTSACRRRSTSGPTKRFGQDAMRVGRIWQEMYRSQYFEGGRVLQAPISAIDIALHDIKGKALGAPVYDLLGGKQRDLIPTFATTRSEASSAEVAFLASTSTIA